MAKAKQHLPDSYMGIVQQVVEAHKRNTLHHAVLFYGPQGSGKRLLVREIIQRLSDTPIAQNPDIIQYDAADNKGIESVREFISWFSETPLVQKKKIGALYALNSLQAQSTNALLKTLEEPPYDSTIFLTAESLHAIPKTIMSRCACLYVQHIPKQEFHSFFASYTQPQALDEVYAITNGRVELARSLLTQNDQSNAIKQYDKEIQSLLDHGASIFDITSEWDKKTLQEEFSLRREIWIQRIRRALPVASPDTKKRYTSLIKQLLLLSTKTPLQLTLHVENIWVQ